MRPTYLESLPHPPKKTALTSLLPARSIFKSDEPAERKFFQLPNDLWPQSALRNLLLLPVALMPSSVPQPPDPTPPPHPQQFVMLKW